MATLWVMTKQLTRSKRQHPFTIIPNALITSDLSKNAFRLYAVLAMHADNDTGEAWPAYKLLQQETRLNPKHIIAALRELEAARWVIRMRRFATSNKYVVASEKPFPSSYTGEELCLPPGSTVLPQGKCSTSNGGRETRLIELYTKELERSDALADSDCGETSELSESKPPERRPLTLDDLNYGE